MFGYGIWDMGYRRQVREDVRLEERFEFSLDSGLRVVVDEIGC